MGVDSVSRVTKTPEKDQTRGEDRPRVFAFGDAGRRSSERAGGPWGDFGAGQVLRYASMRKRRREPQGSNLYLRVQFKVGGCLGLSRFRL